MKTVLYHPQIPQNAGNIVRTCSATGTDLVMISPLGFRTSNRMLKRAGLDYWEGVDVQITDNFTEILETAAGNFYFFSSKATQIYTSINFRHDDILIFGSETAGLPAEFLAQWPDHFYTIPMLPNARCLNLANSVAIVIYEAWRQMNHKNR